MTTRYRFHLIANAHLDPVWLWDWREGFNEALRTTEVMLDLLDQFPELTVIRGETALYEFIERHRPDLFARIKDQVIAKRWEPVGGTYVQNDNNLPATATIIRQFEEGQSYFRRKFDLITDSAWFPDSFGHSAGLPEILSANKIRNFAHCRPFANTLPLAEPAYWWIGAGGARILGYRSPVDWYCNDQRGSMGKRLDDYLLAAKKSSIYNLAVFYGLGNHGGGPTRRIIQDIHAWGGLHSTEVELCHSGLHRYFKALRQELTERPDLNLPEYTGELNFCLRGCYVSTAKIKFPYRRTEHQLIRSERVVALSSPINRNVEVLDLSDAAQQVLFNSFHDILPGSSIERAYDEQIAQLGGAFHAAQTAEFGALANICEQIDTSVPMTQPDCPTAVPFVVFNPHEFGFEGFVEIEAQLDWRPIEGYEGDRTSLVPLEVLGGSGQPIPFQRINTENRAMTKVVWRIRIVLPISLVPGGREVVTIQYLEKPRLLTRTTSVTSDGNQISNEYYTIHAQIGATGLKVFYGNKPMFTGEGLGIWLYEDGFGSWGGLNEESESCFLKHVLEKLEIKEMRVLESGSELARLWIRFVGTNTRVDLSFSLHAKEDAIHVTGRLFLNDRSCRVKLILPNDYKTTVCEVPGGEVERGSVGEVPGIGWLTAIGDGEPLGFVSDALYGFNLQDGNLEVSLARASRYADDVHTEAAEMIHLPAVDSGELKFQFAIAAESDIQSLRRKSRFLQEPVIVQPVASSSKEYRYNRIGSLWQLEDGVEVVSMRKVENGKIKMWVRNVTKDVFSPEFIWHGQALIAPDLEPGCISEWILLPKGLQYELVAPK